MMNRTCRRIGLVILAILHTVLLSYSATCHSPVPDELGHLAAGLSHWQLGDFSLYRVNPPLARMVATLPVYLWEGNEEWLRYYLDPGDFGRSEFAVADQFLHFEKARFFDWLTIARMSSIPFSLVGMVVCYLWARDLYGGWAGVMAAVLWSVSPFVLGFGAILTPDVPSAAMGALSLYTFTRWLRTPGWTGSIVAGISLGLAELTKSTWIILPVVYGLVVFSQLLRHCMSSVTHCTSRKVSPLMQLLGLFLVGWLVFVAGYGFDDVGKPLGSFGFRSKTLSGQPADSNDATGNRFHGTWLEYLPVPLPKQFLVGLDYQKQDSTARKQPAYIAGLLRDNGVWYYYLFALSVKCTIGGMILFGMSIAKRFVAIQRLKPAEWVMVVTAAMILALLSSHTGLNKHSRYLLPILPIAIVWCSQCSVLFTSRLGRGAVVGAMSCAALSSLSVFPHSMSYFNEGIGGASRGRLYLSNSNIDWNQDLYFLRDELRRRGWNDVGLVCSANYDIRIVGLDFFVPPIHPRLQLSKPENESGSLERLQPGKYAISVCHWQGYPVGAPSPTGSRLPPRKNAFSYFQEFSPVGRVGFSILLFDLSQEDIDRTLTWGALLNQAQHDGE
jgi:hypothetical protein